LIGRQNSGDRFDDFCLCRFLGGVAHAIAPLDGKIKCNDQHPPKIVARRRADIEGAQPIVHMGRLDGGHVYIGKGLGELSEAATKIAQISFAGAVALLQCHQFILQG
jgi:hypothetical protein